MLANNQPSRQPQSEPRRACVSILCCRCLIHMGIEAPTLKEVGHPRGSDLAFGWKQRDVQHVRLSDALERNLVKKHRLKQGDDPSVTMLLTGSRSKDHLIRARARVEAAHIDAPNKAAWGAPPEVRAPMGPVARCHLCGHEVVLDMKRTYQRAAQALAEHHDVIPCCNETPHPRGRRRPHARSQSPAARPPVNTRRR